MGFWHYFIFFFCKRQLGLFWSRKWLVNFNARKTQLILFDCSNIFVENSSLKKMGLSLSSTLKSGFYIVTSAKIAFKKMEALIHSMKLHSSELQYKIVDKLQKQLLALLVLLLLLLLNSWFIVHLNWLSYFPHSYGNPLVILVGCRIFMSTFTHQMF